EATSNSSPECCAYVVPVPECGSAFRSLVLLWILVFLFPDSVCFPQPKKKDFSISTGPKQLVGKPPPSANLSTLQRNISSPPLTPHGKTSSLPRKPLNSVSSWPEAPAARALLKYSYGELPSVAPRWLRGLGYLLFFNSAEPGLQFRHPRLQSYKNATFITCTIITKGGRGVTEHLTQRAGERRSLRERNSGTGSHGGAKDNAKLATPYHYLKNRNPSKPERVSAKMLLLENFNHNIID
ncbi:hypothetical protein ILYODFUR_027522, partial [Ilyodon furcidens]